MKIFQVINVRWFNATAWYAIYLSKLLSDDGHDVIVLTLENTPPDQKARELGLKTIPLDLNTNNPLRLAKTCGQIIALLRTYRPDIVNCHRGEGFFLWGLLKLANFGYRLIRTRGDQRLPKSDAFNRWLHAKVADAVVVTNRRMAQHFLSKMKTPESAVWLIQGGVNKTQFAFDEKGRTSVRKEFDFASENHVVGLLGRFDRVKGHRELIETVARLRSQGNENIRLFLIGFDTAMDSNQIRLWLQEYHVEDITRISGKRDDVAACISAMDTGVVASLWSEAIARAALEIMAAKRVLVSSDVGVMPDIVPAEALFEPGNVDEMTRVLGKAVNDEEFREKNLALHKATMSQLGGEDFLNRTLNLYTGLLEKN